MTIKYCILSISVCAVLFGTSLAARAKSDEQNTVDAFIDRYIERQKEIIASKKDVIDDGASEKKTSDPASKLADDFIKWKKITADFQSIKTIYERDGSLKDKHGVLNVEPAELFEQRWLDLEKARVATKILEDAARYTLINPNSINETVVDGFVQGKEQSSILATELQAGNILYMLAAYSRSLALLQTKAREELLDGDFKHENNQQEDARETEKRLSSPQEKLKDIYKTNWEEFKKSGNHSFQAFLWAQVLSQEVLKGDSLVEDVVKAAGIILTAPGFDSFTGAIEKSNIPDSLKKAIGPIRETSAWFTESIPSSHRTEWLSVGRLEAYTEAQGKFSEFIQSVIREQNYESAGGPHTDQSIAESIDDLVNSRIRILLSREMDLAKWLANNKDLYATDRLYSRWLDKSKVKNAIKAVKLIEETGSNRALEAMKQAETLLGEVKAPPAGMKRRLAQQLHEEVLIGELLVNLKTPISSTLNSVVRRLPGADDSKLPIEILKNSNDILDRIHRDLVGERQKLFGFIETAGVSFEPGSNKLGEEFDEYVKEISRKMAQSEKAIKSFKIPTGDWLARQFIEGDGKGVTIGGLDSALKLNVYEVNCSNSLDAEVSNIELTCYVDAEFPAPVNGRPGPMIKLRLLDSVILKLELPKMLSIAEPRLNSIIINAAAEVDPPTSDQIRKLNATALVTSLLNAFPGPIQREQLLSEIFKDEQNIEKGLNAMASETGITLLYQGAEVLELPFNRAIDPLSLNRTFFEIVKKGSKRRAFEIFEEALGNSRQTVKALLSGLQSGHDWMPKPRWKEKGKSFYLPAQFIADRCGLHGTLKGNIEVGRTISIPNNLPAELAELLLAQSDLIGLNKNTLKIRMPLGQWLEIGSLPENVAAKISWDQIGGKSAAVVITFIPNNPELGKCSFGQWTVKLDKKCKIKISLDRRRATTFVDLDNVLVHGPVEWGFPEHPSVGLQISLERLKDRVVLKADNGFGDVQKKLKPLAELLGLNVNSELKEVIRYDDGRICFDGRFISSNQYREAVLKRAEQTARDRLIGLAVALGLCTQEEIDKRPINVSRRKVGRNFLADFTVSLTHASLVIKDKQGGKLIEIMITGDQTTLDAKGLAQKLEEKAKAFCETIGLEKLPLIANIKPVVDASTGISFVATFGDHEGAEVSITCSLPIERDGLGNPKYEVSVTPDALEVAARRKLEEAFLENLKRLIDVGTLQSRLTGGNTEISQGEKEGISHSKMFDGKPFCKLLDYHLPRGLPLNPLFDELKIVPTKHLREYFRKLFNIDLVVGESRISVSSRDKLQVELKADIGNDRALWVTFILSFGESIEVEIPDASKRALEKAVIEMAITEAKNEWKEEIPDYKEFVRQKVKGLEDTIKKILPVGVKLKAKAFPGYIDFEGLQVDLDLPLGDFAKLRIEGLILYARGNQQKGIDVTKASVTLVGENPQSSIEKNILDSLKGLTGSDKCLRISDFQLDRTLEFPNEKPIPLADLPAALEALVLTGSIGLELDLSEIEMLTGIEGKSAVTHRILFEIDKDGFKTSGLGLENLPHLFLKNIGENLKSQLGKVLKDLNENESNPLVFEQASVSVPENVRDPELRFEFQAKFDSKNVTNKELALLLPRFKATFILYSGGFRSNIESIPPDETALRNAAVGIVLGSQIQSMLKLIGLDGMVTFLKDQTLEEANLDVNGIPRGGIFQIDFSTAASGYLPTDVVIPPMNVLIGPKEGVKLLSPTTIVIPFGVGGVTGWAVPGPTFGFTPKSLEVTLPEQLGAEAGIIISATAEAGTMLPPNVLKIVGRLSGRFGKFDTGEEFRLTLEGNGTALSVLPIGNAELEFNLKGRRDLKDEGQLHSPYLYAEANIGGVAKKLFEADGYLYAGKVKGRSDVNSETSVNGRSTVVLFQQLKLNETIFKLDRKRLHVGKEMDLFIAKMKANFNMPIADPFDATVRGDASIGFQSWKLAGADILARIDEASLAARVLGLKLRVNVGSPAGMTPKVVRKAIVDLFTIPDLLGLLKNLLNGDFRFNMAGSMSWSSPKMDGSSNDGDDSSDNKSSFRESMGDGDPTSGEPTQFKAYKALLDPAESGGDDQPIPQPEALALPEGKGGGSFIFTPEKTTHHVFEVEEDGTNFRHGILQNSVGPKDKKVVMFAQRQAKGLYLVHGQLAHIPLALSEVFSGRGESDKAKMIQEAYGINLDAADDSLIESLNPRFYAQLLAGSNKGKAPYELYVLLNTVDLSLKDQFSNYYGAFPLDARLGFQKKLLQDAKNGKDDSKHIQQVLERISLSLAERLAWGHVRNFCKENVKGYVPDVPEIAKGSNIVLSDTVQLVSDDLLIDIHNKDDVVAIAWKYDGAYVANMVIHGREPAKPDNPNPSPRTVCVTIGDFEGLMELDIGARHAALQEFLKTAADAESTVVEPRIPAPLIHTIQLNELNNKKRSGVFRPAIGAGAGKQGKNFRATAKKRERERVDYIRSSFDELEGTRSGSDASFFLHTGGPPNPVGPRLHPDDNGVNNRKFPQDRPVVGTFDSENSEWVRESSYIDPFIRGKPSLDNWRAFSNPRPSSNNQYDLEIDTLITSPQSGGRATAATLYGKERNLDRPKQIEIPITFDWGPLKSTGNTSYQREDFTAFYGNWIAFNRIGRVLDGLIPGYPEKRMLFEQGDLGCDAELKTYPTLQPGRDKSYYWEITRAVGGKVIKESPLHLIYSPHNKDRETNGGYHSAGLTVMAPPNSDHVISDLLKHRSVVRKDGDSLFSIYKQRAEQRFVRILPTNQENGVLAIEAKSPSSILRNLAHYSKESAGRSIPIRLNAFDIGTVLRKDGRFEKGVDSDNTQWFYGEHGKTYREGFLELLSKVDVTGIVEQRVEEEHTKELDCFALETGNAADPTIFGILEKVGQDNEVTLTLHLLPKGAKQVQSINIEGTENLIQNPEHIGPIFRYILTNFPNKSWSWEFIDLKGNDKNVTTWFRPFESVDEDGENKITRLKKIYAAVGSGDDVKVRLVGDVGAADRDENFGAQVLEDLSSEFAFAPWWRDRVINAFGEPSLEDTPLFKVLDAEDSVKVVAFARPETTSESWGVELRWFHGTDKIIDQLPIEFAVQNNEGGSSFLWTEFMGGQVNGVDERDVVTAILTKLDAGLFKDSNSIERGPTSFAYQLLPYLNKGGKLEKLYIYKSTTTRGTLSVVENRNIGTEVVNGIQLVGRRSIVLMIKKLAMAKGIAASYDSRTIASDWNPSAIRKDPTAEAVHLLVPSNESEKKGWEGYCFFQNAQSEGEAAFWIDSGHWRQEPSVVVGEVSQHEMVHSGFSVSFSNDSQKSYLNSNDKKLIDILTKIQADPPLYLGIPGAVDWIWADNLAYGLTSDSSFPLSLVGEEVAKKSMRDLSNPEQSKLFSRLSELYSSLEKKIGGDRMGARSELHNVEGSWVFLTKFNQFEKWPQSRIVMHTVAGMHLDSLQHLLLNETLPHGVVEWVIGGEGGMKLGSKWMGSILRQHGQENRSLPRLLGLRGGGKDLKVLFARGSESDILELNGERLQVRGGLPLTATVGTGFDVLFDSLDQHIPEHLIRMDIPDERSKGIWFEQQETPMVKRPGVVEGMFGLRWVHENTRGSGDPTIRVYWGPGVKELKIIGKFCSAQTLVGLLADPSWLTAVSKFSNCVIYPLPDANNSEKFRYVGIESPKLGRIEFYRLTEESIEAVSKPAEVGLFQFGKRGEIKKEEEHQWERERRESNAICGKLLSSVLSKAGSEEETKLTISMVASHGEVGGAVQEALEVSSVKMAIVGWSVRQGYLFYETETGSIEDYSLMDVQLEGGERGLQMDERVERWGDELICQAMILTRVGGSAHGYCREIFRIRCKTPLLVYSDRLWFCLGAGQWDKEFADPRILRLRELMDSSNGVKNQPFDLRQGYRLKLMPAKSEESVPMTAESLVVVGYNKQERLYICIFDRQGQCFEKLEGDLVNGDVQAELRKLLTDYSPSYASSSQENGKQAILNKITLVTGYSLRAFELDPIKSKLTFDNMATFFLVPHVLENLKEVASQQSVDLWYSVNNKSIRGLYYRNALGDPHSFSGVGLSDENDELILADFVRNERISKRVLETYAKEEDSIELASTFELVNKIRPNWLGGNKDRPQRPIKVEIGPRLGRDESVFVAPRSRPAECYKARRSGKGLDLFLKGAKADSMYSAWALEMIRPDKFRVDPDKPAIEVFDPNKATPKYSRLAFQVEVSPSEDDVKFMTPDRDKADLVILSSDGRYQPCMFAREGDLDYSDKSPVVSFARSYWQARSRLGGSMESDPVRAEGGGFPVCRFIEQTDGQHAMLRLFDRDSKDSRAELWRFMGDKPSWSRNRTVVDKRIFVEQWPLFRHSLERDAVELHGGIKEVKYVGNTDSDWRWIHWKDSNGYAITLSKMGIRGGLENSESDRWKPWHIPEFVNPEDSPDALMKFVVAVANYHHKKGDDLKIISDGNAEHCFISDDGTLKSLTLYRSGQDRVEPLNFDMKALDSLGAKAPSMDLHDSLAGDAFWEKLETIQNMNSPDVFVRSSSFECNSPIVVAVEKNGSAEIQWFMKGQKPGRGDLNGLFEALPDDLEEYFGDSDFAARLAWCALRQSQDEKNEGQSPLKFKVKEDKDRLIDSFSMLAWLGYSFEAGDKN